MEDLSKRWKSAKEAIDISSFSAVQLERMARKKKKNISSAHYVTILILSITLIGISYFFFKVVSFQHWLSKIGMTFMIGSLIIRIIVEIISTVKASKINVSNDVSSITQQAITFHRYRRKVHSLFTILIVGFYVIGFYLLTPEFNLYIKKEWLLLMHLSFLIGACFVFIQARKGIREEMKALSELVDIRKEMTDV